MSYPIYNDTSDLGGLLGQFAVPEDERRKQQAMALIMASLQFAGARKGQELQNLAPAMATGLGTYYGKTRYKHRRMTLNIGRLCRGNTRYREVSHRTQWVLR